MKDAAQLFIPYLAFVLRQRMPATATFTANCEWVNCDPAKPLSCCQIYGYDNWGYSDDEVLVHGDIVLILNERKSLTIDEYYTMCYTIMAQDGTVAHYSLYSPASLKRISS